jgi:hypothetical protein
MHENVNWTIIQRSLVAAPCDVLLILNCCHAGNAADLSQHGTTEILGASDRDSPTGTLDNSFLRYLREVLITLASTPPAKFSVERLRNELDIYNTREHGKKINHPFLKRFPDDHASIILQPLPSSASVSRRTTDAQSSLDSSSFYVKYTIDAPEEVSQAAWATFFARSDYPGTVRNLHFYTSEKLREELHGQNEEHTRGRRSS